MFPRSIINNNIVLKDMGENRGCGAVEPIKRWLLVVDNKLTTIMAALPSLPCVLLHTTELLTRWYVNLMDYERVGPPKPQPTK